MALIIALAVFFFTLLAILSLRRGLSRSTNGPSPVARPTLTAETVDRRAEIRLALSIFLAEALALAAYFALRT